MSSPSDTRALPQERLIVLLIAAVNFINILDFMIVMPMGPFFGRALGIPESNLGMIGGAYTAAASVAGVAGSFFLDRFDRRRALAVCMLGLIVGTAAGGLATGFVSLMLARVVAGAFGGPATSLAVAIISDVIPVERRGRAVGAVAGAFSVASVLGVPLGLFSSEALGWRAPFLLLAALGLVVAGTALFVMPPMRGHLSVAGPAPALGEIVRRPLVLQSYLLTFVVMMAGFLVVPNIAAFVLGNLGLPAQQLKLMYLVGGVASFVTLRYAGRLVDRYGSFRVGLGGSFGSAGVVGAVFVAQWAWLPAPVVFVAFMVTMMLRNVSYNTLTTKVPLPPERARFQSLQSGVQHAASSAGAFLSSLMLATEPVLGEGGLVSLASDGKPLQRLVHMNRVGALSIALSLLIPLLLLRVETRVRAAKAPRAATF